MKITKFEDIVSWQKSQQLATLLYSIFKTNSDYSFKDQILRATISIGNNIAEGFERYSNKDLRNFLFIAKGSCGEVRSMLYIALALKYINQTEYSKCNNLCIDISKLIGGLIKTL